MHTLVGYFHYTGLGESTMCSSTDKQRRLQCVCVCVGGGQVDAVSEHVLPLLPLFLLLEHPHPHPIIMKFLLPEPTNDVPCSIFIKISHRLVLTF